MVDHLIPFIEPFATIARYVAGRRRRDQRRRRGRCWARWRWAARH